MPIKFVDEPMRTRHNTPIGPAPHCGRLLPALAGYHVVRPGGNKWAQRPAARATLAGSIIKLPVGFR